MKPLPPSPFLDIELGGDTLRCEYDYTPGTPDVMHLSNGDPGHPGDPEEFCVTAVKLRCDGGDLPCWCDITELVLALTNDEGKRINSLVYAVLMVEQAAFADERPGDDYGTD
jgi:hypothetical protein